MNRRAAKAAPLIVAGVAAVVVSAPRLGGFAGEHPLLGHPWHHEHISELALEEVGFDVVPADDIAWHADYIDSYNYMYGSTAWLFVDVLSGEWVDRHKVALATYENLARLHFDDLVSTDQVNAAWRRYLTGTLAGLVWASEQGPEGDIAAAQNILGVSLHAIQDFYSHSNWIDDPERWTRTWFQLSAAERRRLSLYTGSYERSPHRGVRPHGVISLECSILQSPVFRSLGIDAFLEEAACIGISPISNSGLCRQWTACQSGTSSAAIAAPGIEVPEGLVYVHPEGINLDSTWLARIGGETRGLFRRDGSWATALADTLASTECRNLVWGDYGAGLSPAAVDSLIGFWGDVFPFVRVYARNVSVPRACDTPSEHLFAVSKRLARDASIQWLYILDLAMRRAGKEEFWNRVKHTPGSRETEFEHYDRFPYQFLSAGSYPPSGGLDREELYLRVLLETAAETDAGTDTRVQLRANGATFDLDYLPDVVAFLQYNDFEAGDRQVYTVGPLDRLPETIALVNRASDADDVILSIGNSLGEGIDGVLETIRSIGLALIAGNADYVGEGRRVWTPEDLAALDERPHEYRIRIDGGDEGSYIVHVVVRRTATTPRNSVFQVEVEKIHCVRESATDGLVPSSSDEPFFFISLIPLPGESQDAQIGPAESTDSGEDVALRDGFPGRMIYDPIKLPSNYGMFAVAVQVWEHDNESGLDRRALRNEFVDRLEEPVSRLRSDVIAVAGEAIANAWKLGSIRVDAFTRGGRVAVGRVLDQRVDAWIDAGESRSFTLDRGRLRTVPVEPEALERIAFETMPAAAYAPVARPRANEIDPVEERMPGPVPRLPRNVPPAGVVTAEPAPEDCLTYDPARLRIEDRGALGWLLLDREHALQRLATRGDAEAALRVARRHTMTCFAGRDGRGPGRMVFSWLTGVGAEAELPLPGEDCLSYDPAAIAVGRAGARWTVTAGTAALAALATAADAERVALALRGQTRICYVGRDNPRPDREAFILTYLEP